MNYFLNRLLSKSVNSATGGYHGVSDGLEACVNAALAIIFTTAGLRRNCKLHI